MMETIIEGYLGFVGKGDEVRHNGQIWKGLSLAESYYTGKFEICFPFDGCGKLVREPRVLGHDLVLVGQIKAVDGLNHLVPARIRLEFLYFSHDLFAGATYMSTVNGGFQSVRRGAERDLDLPPLSGSWAFVTNQRKCEQVKGGTQVVNGIADDQGESVWNGYLVFDDIGNLVGLAVSTAINPQRTLACIGFGLPVNVIDVMFGPFNQ